MPSARAPVDGLSDVLKRGHPLVLAGDGDVGGLLGIHLREEMKIDNAIVSVDGLELKISTTSTSAPCCRHQVLFQS